MLRQRKNCIKVSLTGPVSGLSAYQHEKTFYQLRNENSRDRIRKILNPMAATLRCGC